MCIHHQIVQHNRVGLTAGHIVCPPSSVSCSCLLCVCSHRVLRHTVFICASRSLSVQASACRSSVPPHHRLDDGGGGTLVFVDVENINTVSYGARLQKAPVEQLLTRVLVFPRAKAACASSTSSRCPAAVSAGASTGASTRPVTEVNAQPVSRTLPKMPQWRNHEEQSMCQITLPKLM